MDTKMNYERIFGNGEAVVECNEESVVALLRHFNEVESWQWGNLPSMNIGYTLNQYDCDGKRATAIVLDKAIEVGGESTKRIVVGAPRQHLMKYTHIRQ